MTLLQIALLGAVIGVPLGYAMQRTNLCFNSAYREAILRRNTIPLRVIVLAILIQMAGLLVLVQLGLGSFSLNVVPFFWLAAIVGGFVFGLIGGWLCKKSRPQVDYTRWPRYPGRWRGW